MRTQARIRTRIHRSESRNYDLLSVYIHTHIACKVALQCSILNISVSVDSIWFNLITQSAMCKCVCVFLFIIIIFLICCFSLSFFFWLNKYIHISFGKTLLHPSFQMSLSILNEKKKLLSIALQDEKFKLIFSACFQSSYVQLIFSSIQSILIVAVISKGILPFY